MFQALESDSGFCSENVNAPLYHLIMSLNEANNEPFVFSANVSSHAAHVKFYFHFVILVHYLVVATFEGSVER